MRGLVRASEFRPAKDPEKWGVSVWLQALLAGVVCVGGALLILRVLIGPFEPFRSARSELNLACFAGAAFVWNAVLRSFPGTSDRTARARAYAASLPLILSCAPFLAFLSTPFLADEFTLFWMGRTWSPAVFLHGLTHGSFGGDEYYRPLTYASFGVNALFAGFNPVLWHLPGLLIHVINTWLVYLLAARVSQPLWAALLFGVNGALAETVSGMATRFDLLATFFVLLSLIAFLDYDAHGRKGSLAASCCALVLGLLSKESAYVAPLLLIAAIGMTGQLSWPRIRRTLPAFLLTLTVFCYRWHLLGGIGGYKDASSGARQIYGLQLLPMLKGLVLRVWGLLLFPINWSVEPEWWLAAAILLAVVCMAILTRAKPDARQALGALSFVVIALLPVASFLLIGPDLMGAPRLYLASAGFALFMGSALCALRGRRLQAVIGSGLLLFQFAALHHNLVIWREAGDVARTICSGAPNPAEVPTEHKGVRLFGDALSDCIKFYSSAPTGNRTGRPVRLER